MVLAFKFSGSHHLLNTKAFVRSIFTSQQFRFAYVHTEQYQSGAQHRTLGDAGGRMNEFAASEISGLGHEQGASPMKPVPRCCPCGTQGHHGSMQLYCYNGPHIRRLSTTRYQRNKKAYFDNEPETLCRTYEAFLFVFVYFLSLSLSRPAPNKRKLKP